MFADYMLENLVISVWSQTVFMSLWNAVQLENLVISVWSQTHPFPSRAPSRLRTL